jgi:hypothetical protein
VTRRLVPPSVFCIDRRGEDAQREHAARLIISGWDIESAATLTGLPIETVREIAGTVDADDLANGPPLP